MRSFQLKGLHSVLLLLFFAVSLSAQRPFVLHDGFYHENPSRYFVVAEDPTRQQTLDGALQLPYKAVEQDVPNFGFSYHSYWFKGLLINAGSQTQFPIFEVGNPNLDRVALFVFSKKGVLLQKTTGDLYPFRSRSTSNKYFQFPLKLEPGDSLQVVLNVQNSGEQFHVPLQLGNSAFYIERDDNEQMIFGMYFGIILFVLLLNSFFYSVLKDKIALLYIGYVFCLLFLQLSLSGTGFKYLWSGSTFMANHANPIFATTSIFFLLKFSQRFLNIRHYLPRMNRLYNWFSVLIGTTVFAAWINHHGFYIFSVLTINLMALVLNVMIIPTAWYILRKHYKPARFFMVAFVVLILSVFVFVLRNAGLIPSTFITNYGLQIGSSLEVLLLTLAVIDKYSEFKTEALSRLEEVNALKTQTNIELEAKVEDRTQKINRQRAQLQQKNEEILASIRYARRIQDALLPSDEVLNELFKGNYFVYYAPKDIVSGDFYWATEVRTTNEQRSYSLVAVADCTGHGVPGAFMSILSSNFLKQSATEKTVNNPAEALDFINQKVISTLNHDSAVDSVRDGMDISLVAIDYEARKLSYAGANNPVYLLRHGEVTELRSDKQAIGSLYDHIRNYTHREVDLEPGDCIYMFTDGYADQFGGERGKKMNYKRFREILVTVSALPIREQEQLIRSAFENWRGSEEQIDDVCVVGIKID